MYRKKRTQAVLARRFSSLGSLSQTSRAEVEHGSGDDDGRDTRKGTWERAEEMELSLEMYIEGPASSEVDENASSTSLAIPDSSPKAKRTRANDYTHSDLGPYNYDTVREKLAGVSHRGSSQYQPEV